MAQNITNMNEALKDESGALQKEQQSPTISNSKVGHSITSKSLQIVDILCSRFLKSVKAGNVDIHNTKELKDVITVYLQLHDIEQGGSQDTPQINIEAAKFMGQQFREPHDNNNLNAGIKKKLPNLNDNQVHQLLKNQEKEINNENIKKM